MFVVSCQVYICFKTIHSLSFLCFISILFKGICLHKAANKKNTGAKTHTIYLHTNAALGSGFDLLTQH